MAGLFCTSCNLETAIGGSAGNGPFSNVSGNVTLGVGNGPAGNNTLAMLQNSFCTASYSFIVGAGAVAGFGLSCTSPVLARAMLFGFNIVGSTNVRLYVDPDGTLSVISGGGNLLVQSPPGIFQFTGARQMVEVYLSGLTVLPGGITAKIQYEGAVVATGTGNQAGANYWSPNFGNRDPVGGSYPVTVAAPLVYDSMYLLDLTGTARNAPLGKRVVMPFSAAGSGQYSQWAPNGAPTLWQAVAPIPPQGDASFASSANVGDQMAVAIAAPAGLQSVDFVMQRADARQDVAAGGRSVALGIGNGTAVTYGATKQLGNTYAGYNQVWDVDPTTGQPWTLVGLAAKQLAAQTMS